MVDSLAIGTVTSKRGNKWRVNRKNKAWQKGPHVRKTAVQPLTMQRKDKRGPKKMGEERAQRTVWPSSEKPPQEAQQRQRRTNDSDGTLRFTCSQCWDNVEYVPKDLVRHFEEKHRGSPPVFSCHMCTFSTQKFSYLQVHLLSHKDTFSSCSLCNDNVQRTWSEFSAHLTAHHCQNGKYSCETCHKFSTGDVGVFLEHMHAHNLGLEAASANLSLQTKDRSKSGPKTQRCQHCGYEAPQKLLINKHIQAVHICLNGNRRKKKKKMREIEDPIPKTKPRLTRSAVREMCWLTQDCLSLPGREFLDKYCHLSDPQTTLEETQQFLMKSVAGEGGDQKWTKALQTVLSNVPQDLNLHPKSEDGITSDSSDLTVLTVKNKITVAQNGASYAKKLKMTTSSDKETFSHEIFADNARHVVGQNLNDHTTCPQTDAKLNNEASLAAQNEPSDSPQTQDDRERRVLKTDQEMKEPMHEDGINLSTELKVTEESEEQTSACKAVPKRKRRRRKARSRRRNKRSAGSSLAVVLKKNPVMEKRWVSQGSLSPSGGDLTGDSHIWPCPRAPVEEMEHILHNMLLAHQKKWTKASKTDPQDCLEADTSTPRLTPAEKSPSCSPKPARLKDAEKDVAQSSLSPQQESGGDAEKSEQLVETEMDVSSRSNSTAAPIGEAQVSPENVQTQTSEGGMDRHVTEDEMTSAADGVTPPSESYPDSLTNTMPQETRNLEDSGRELFPEVSVEGASGKEAPAESFPDLISPALDAIPQEPPPPFERQWPLVPKTVERTLKLVAINPSQPVKRPAGDQPVVVLNHPDADIPEVVRIMQVVNRYREVQKVVLSRRTASALSAMSSEVPKKSEPDVEQLGSTECCKNKNCVQERFVLKLKLRRLSRKKYEVVGGVSPSADAAKTFTCWYCGRVFACQEKWLVHRRRHLMEWK